MSVPGSQQDLTGSPSRPDSRRRGSSFGFLSSITNSLRNNNSSSSNLQQSSTGRSRAGSSSRQLAGGASAGGGAGGGVGSSRSVAQPIAQSVTAGYFSDNHNNGSNGQFDMYAATPTEENMMQDATRRSSPLPRQSPDSDGLYSIRLTPFIDHSSTTPALYFGPILRKTKPGARLSIGRYTEKVRETAYAPQGSDAGVVFKSKVVSRTHGEFYVDNYGNWYVKDLKSSSGTFLNHVRLSPAGIESADTPLQNGDILQLGMDFRGGIEDIFRCVKMRVEINKSWQRKANQFNKEAHQRLKTLAMMNDSELSECAICLLKVRPCQAVFISPCSHCWHYKCIRPIVIKSYPQFLCPNCRETCDLEADLDEDSDAENEAPSTDADDDAIIIEEAEAEIGQLPSKEPSVSSSNDDDQGTDRSS